MNPEELESLRRLVAYASPDEERDFTEQREAGEDVSGHIWLDLETLSRYLARMEPRDVTHTGREREPADVRQMNGC